MNTSVSLPSTEEFLAIEDLILHRSPMLLLESVVEWDEMGVSAVVNPASSYLFADSQGAIPAWVGIEYMAQTISAFAGIVARSHGKPISVGLLLGTRRYTTQVASFAPEQKLLVKVRELLRDETNLVLFDCQIYADKKLLASAEIKALEPDDVKAVIAQFAQTHAVMQEKLQ
ncbi:MAG: beta-hydroxyacyl-ACP dehydratase [Pseudomonadota bacterium]